MRRTDWDSFEIQHVAVEAGTATVTAELRNGTGSSEGVFTLTSSSAGAFSPTVWELAPVVLPELEIDLTFGVQEIEIEGVTFPVEDLRVERETYESRIALQLLPGTYEVTLPEVPPWLEAPQAALEVLPAFGATAAPLHSLSPTFDETSQAEVQHQIDAALEGCAARTSSIPEGCPFAVPGHAGQGAWRITHPPRVDATPVGLFLWMVHGEGTAQFTPSGESGGRGSAARGALHRHGRCCLRQSGHPRGGPGQRRRALVRLLHRCGRRRYHRGRSPRGVRAGRRLRMWIAPRPSFAVRWSHRRHRPLRPAALAPGSRSQYPRLRRGR